MENTFPGALVDRINAMRVDGVDAEHVHIGGIKMAEPSGYRVIVDRISHDIAFYRAYLKNAVLNGTHSHQQSFLVGRRRQILQLRAGIENRRRRAATPSCCRTNRIRPEPPRNPCAI